MKVKDVLSLAADCLGREDLSASLLASSSATGEALNLLRCYNLIENELAVDYFPLQYEEEVCPNQGEIAYSSLGKQCAEILSVECEGEKIAFRETDGGISLEKTLPRATVRYLYIPQRKELTADAETDKKVTARLMAFGISSEFCLSRGQFSEAAIWERKYQDAVRAADCKRRRKKMRSRRWV